jgi:hypothetical protein
MDDRLTLIDDGRAVEVPARLAGDEVRLRPDDVRDVLGWELKPEGLCREGVCVPARAEPSLATADGIDLAALARLLGRPLAVDAGERAAYLGIAARDRAAQLTTLQAPDFTLPDLAGHPHSLSDYRGRKVLLIAYASW